MDLGVRMDRRSYRLWSTSVLWEETAGTSAGLSGFYPRVWPAGPAHDPSVKVTCQSLHKQELRGRLQQVPRARLTHFTSIHHNNWAEQSYSLSVSPVLNSTLLFSTLVYFSLFKRLSHPVKIFSPVTNRPVHLWIDPNRCIYFSLSVLSSFSCCSCNNLLLPANSQ